jgi:hypothetical protein
MTPKTISGIVGKVDRAIVVLRCDFPPLQEVQVQVGWVVSPSAEDRENLEASIYQVS